MKSSAVLGPAFKCEEKSGANLRDLGRTEQISELGALTERAAVPFCTD
jgi:hypothetical protein